MKCPKCKTINPPGATECDSCGVIFADIRGNKERSVDRLCPWNDHGHVCGLVGSMSDATNGSGPWYCSRHFWQLKGWPLKDADDAKPHISYRERWYAERGLPYEPPKLDCPVPWRPVAADAVDLYARLRDGTLGPRQREPGED